MRKRIFIAITISESLQNEILKWVRTHDLLPVRWLSGKNLHITILPPWYEEDVEAIQRKLRERSGDIDSFTVTFNSVTFGPDPRQPRLIWAAGETPQSLISLKESIEKALHVESEKRRFKLHLTIARFRERDLQSFSIQELNETVLWKTQVNEFVIMESHLSPNGSEYKVLEAIPF